MNPSSSIEDKTRPIPTDTITIKGMHSALSLKREIVNINHVLGENADAKTTAGKCTLTALDNNLRPDLTTSL